MKLNLITNRSVIISLVLLVLTAGAFLIGRQMNNQIYWIDINRTFENFDMKNELQMQYKSTLSSVEKRIDSLSVLISSDVQTNPAADGESKSKVERLLLQEYMQRRQFLQTEELDQIDHQIQTRMIEYLSEFSENKGCQYLLANNNNLPIIHGSSDKDLTEEAIVFINEKYKNNAE